MSYKASGTVFSVSEIQVVSEKFSKREVVLEDSSSKYPQFLCFQFTQDKVNDLNNIAAGQEVEISFNLRGRNWTDPNGVVKTFNTLEGWKIDEIGHAPPQVVANVVPTTEDSQDLPF